MVQARQQGPAAELHQAGESSLVAGDREAACMGQVGFCTTALLTLCVTGSAEGVLDPTPTPAITPRVGITAELGLAGDFVLGRWLKAPEKPVWVLRWGAHYSCVWLDGGRFWHYNGAVGAREFTSVPVVQEPLPTAPPPSPSHSDAQPTTAANVQGKVLTFIQRRPPMDGLSDDSEVHVIWDLVPVGQESKPETSELAGDKWYCASCYSEGQTWAPNWNDPGTIWCGSCRKDRESQPSLA